MFKSHHTLATEKGMGAGHR